MFLTICIPTYNRDIYLKDNLNKIINEIEIHELESQIGILVMDNASSDNTRQYVDELKLNRVRLHYICNEKNLGIDGNIQKGITVCESKYVWLLGDDDEIYGNKINYIYTYLKEMEHLDLGLVILNYDVYNESLSSARIHLVSKDNDVTSKSADFFFSSFCHLLTFISLVILDKSKIPDEIIKSNKYVGSLYYHYYLGMYCAKKYGYSFISDPCIKFRSGRSDLGAPLSAALWPFRIIEMEAGDLLINRKELSVAQKKAFIKHVLPWIVTAKKRGRFNSESLIKIYHDYKHILYFWISALPVFVIPLRMISIVRKIKNMKKSIN